MLSRRLLRCSSAVGALLGLVALLSYSSGRGDAPTFPKCGSPDYSPKHFGEVVSHMYCRMRLVCVSSPVKSGVCGRLLQDQKASGAGWGWAQTLRRAETAAAQSIERGATIENRPRQWRKKSPQKALRSLESSPVVHGVAQALESSLVQTSGAVKHRRPRHSKRKSPEHVLHSLESSPIVAQAPESSLAGSKPDPSNPSDTQGRPSFAWQAPLTQRSTTAAVPSAAAPQARAAHATAPSSAKQVDTRCFL